MDKYILEDGRICIDNEHYHYTVKDGYVYYYYDFKGCRTYVPVGKLKNEAL